MKDFQLTKCNLQHLFDKIQRELETHPVLIVTTQSGNIGKWGMARLWRAWMATTADFMAKNGCSMPLLVNALDEIYGKRPFNSADAHELFTSQHLGTDENGVRLSWSKKGHDGMRPATKGERFNALFRHNVWCTERGINLFKPRGSEYEQIEQEQNR